jgi:hypothetical protein
MQAAPARADFCIQLSGDLSGDLGFFRFLGDLPNEKGTITPLTGRVAGLSPVWGSAVVIKKPGMSYLEIGATFYADSVLGQINVTFSPPGNRDGSGVGDYGTFGSTASFTAQRVACKLEP